ncbi:hypothetical protein P167DRAFT_577854 [Morchella conica CCBAS932]|uniref:Uncharacterized protein n=1 Tax=Morchella conica CCBAS932 TaxID=1392247 RepID=A0A3N4KHJ0_9PEZI|nr:hypothetical protein P167DRAFT_577854 [Morchella conica CCBAS932]
MPEYRVRQLAFELFSRQRAELTYCHNMRLRLTGQIAAYETDAADSELARNYLLLRTPEVMMNSVLRTLIREEKKEAENKLRILRGDLAHVERHIVDFEVYLGRLKEELEALYGDLEVEGEDENEQEESEEEEDEDEE